jgi:hypothetical protein
MIFRVQECGIAVYCSAACAAADMAQVMTISVMSGDRISDDWIGEDQ